MYLDKKKYKKEEVEQLIASLKNDYENRLKELKDGLKEKTEENLELKSRLSAYKKKESIITDAVLDAEEKGKKLKSREEKDYKLAVATLSSFLARFKTYFEYLSEKYPMYPAAKEGADIYKRIENALKFNKSKNAVRLSEKEINKLSEKSSGTGAVATAVKGKKGKKVPPFDPQAKINEYISATGENGFDMEEVLNPGELKLEDLCKELGLLENE